MIVRGALLGSAWKKYEQGGREVSGVAIPEGMHEFQIFEKPLITPTTKDEHDTPISIDGIIEAGLATAEQVEQMCGYSLQLFRHGQKEAEGQGLFLADTKFEYGMVDGELIAIDEVLTPDASRHFYLDEYNDHLEDPEKNPRPRQMSKEFVREWLKENGFTGEEGQEVPDLPAEVVAECSSRYIELFETVMGRDFVSAFKPGQTPKERTEQIGQRIEEFLQNY
jgi:phosphoribosylaminoimidazole-succinocarboxamide synthase